jgi:hypothetical protein
MSLKPEQESAGDVQLQKEGIRARTNLGKCAEVQKGVTEYASKCKKGVTENKNVTSLTNCGSFGERTSLATTMYAV